MINNTTTVILTQPGPARQAIQAAPQNIRDFSDGICGCCNECSSCLAGCFCLPCLACHVARKMDEDCCCAGFCLAPASWVALRTKLRTMYGIRGSITKDHYCICCCACLALTQMNRHINNMAHQEQ